MKEFKLATLTVFSDLASECISAILDSIIFHRSFIPTMPIDIHSKNLGITWSKLADTKLDQSIKSKISSQSSTYSISFHQRQNHQNQSWLPSVSNSTPSSQVWERWSISISIQPTPTTDIGEKMSDILLSISNTCNLERDHVPSITVSGIVIKLILRYLSLSIPCIS